MASVYDIRNGDVYGGLGLHDVAQNKFRCNNTSYDEGFLEHRAQKLMRRYGLQPHTRLNDASAVANFTSSCVRGGGLLSR